MTLRPQKLIILSEHYSPSTCATAQLITDLSVGLDQRGLDVTVITSTAASITDSHLGVQAVRLGINSYSKVNIISKVLSGFSFSIAACHWLSKHLTDGTKLLIVSNPPFVVLIGFFYRLLKNTQYYFLLQDLFPRSAELTGVLPFRGPVSGFWRLLIRASCVMSERTIVLSESMKKRASVEYALVPDQISVIHNWAVEQAILLPKKANPLALDWGFDKQFTVQYSGNFGRLHEIITLLESARLLVDSPIHYVFIGGGAKYDQIVSYKNHYNLTNVSLKPYQPRSTLPLSLGACDMSVVSLIPGSEDTVAPSKLYGILASAKPVLLISNATSNLANLITTYTCGIVVSPGDPCSLAEKLSALSNDPIAIQKMSENAAKLYKKLFAKDISIDQYYKLISGDN